jgi:F0F1-type ATP synthase membrane subunit c/vacuolar-type H+-ATPase subunit K
MVKRAVLALVAVFVAWSALDFVIHGVLLCSVYSETISLWRPMDQMNMPLTSAVTLVKAACFVAIYWLLVSPKSLKSGILYGAIIGISAGFSMGFGSYCFMPITLTLAWAWFLMGVADGVVAGAIVGAIVKQPKAKAAA